MLEMLINPKRAEQRPWEMFWIGLVYASLSILLVNWVFSHDKVLSEYSGIFMIMFCVIFSMPFMYYLIKLEELKDMEYRGMGRLLREHSKAIMALLWLFLGFIVALSFWYIVLPNPEINFKAQLETYCAINRPVDFGECVSEYGIVSSTGKITGQIATTEKVFALFANNIYVLMFTLIFSLVFGAGAIFVLAWNASVIAAAVGIFAKSQITNLPLGIARYMIHGLPEITTYFIAALAGGILSIAIIRHDTRSEKFWSVVQDSLALVIIAVIILFISAFIEVFITPALF